MPLFPRGANFQPGFLRNSFSYPGRLRVSGWSKATCLPWSAISRGLGSNESTCDTPPLMNRRITDFALAGKCGFFGARGSLLSAASSSLSSPDIRSEPATEDCTNSRRDTIDMALLHEEELVAGQEDPGQGRPAR